MRVRAVSHKSNRSSRITPAGWAALISTSFESNHSQTSLPLNALQFRKNPYSSLNSVRYLNRFCEHEILCCLRHRQKSSYALLSTTFHAAGSVVPTSIAPKICICSNMPLGSTERTHGFQFAISPWSFYWGCSPIVEQMVDEEFHNIPYN